MLESRHWYVKLVFTVPPKDIYITIVVKEIKRLMPRV